MCGPALIQMMRADAGSCSFARSGPQQKLASDNLCYGRPIDEPKSGLASESSISSIMASRGGAQRCNLATLCPRPCRRCFLALVHAHVRVCVAACACAGAARSRAAAMDLIRCMVGAQLRRLAWAAAATVACLRCLSRAVTG